MHVLRVILTKQKGHTAHLLMQRAVLPKMQAISKGNDVIEKHKSNFLIVAINCRRSRAMQRTRKRMRRMRQHAACTPSAVRTAPASRTAAFSVQGRVLQSSWPSLRTCSGAHEVAMTHELNMYWTWTGHWLSCCSAFCSLHL